MATFTNKATLSYNNGSTDSNVVTGEITEVLSVSKTALDCDYGAGCPNTYLISITNTGSCAFNGITVTDDLGEYDYCGNDLTPLTYIDGSLKYFVNGTPQAAPRITCESPLTICGIDIPACSNVMLIYKAYANQYAPLGDNACITNTATIRCTGLQNDIEASATICHANESELSITKTLSPETVTENCEVTYTFVIQNRGGAPVEACENAVVTDIFDPKLTNLCVTLDSALLTEGADYTYNTNTGLFRTVAGKITVPAATYCVDDNGAWSITPKVTVLRVTGRI